MNQENTNEPLNKTAVMRGFFISKFEKDLEIKYIDTVCFMGYGYDVKDVKVGAEFYFSYLYYGRMSDMRGGTKEDCLRSVLMHNKEYNFFDKYKILQKHKYFNCSVIDHETKKVIPAKERREYVRIKNLRTNEISVMKPDDLDYSHLFCWTLW